MKEKKREKVWKGKKKQVTLFKHTLRNCFIIYFSSRNEVWIVCGKEKEEKKREQKQTEKKKKQVLLFKHMMVLTTRINKRLNVRTM